jgi:Uma2 family endonuclease
MIADGYFATEERFELLEGLIVEKTSRDPIHDAVVELVEGLLRGRIPAGWRVRGQSAIVTGDSQPEPDVVVVRGTPRDHFAHHPLPQELALVVEVSNSSVSEDRTLKQRIYARAAVPEYWIVNVVDRRVEVYQDPTGPDAAPAYRRRSEYGLGEFVPLTVAGAAAGVVPVAEILP